MAESIKLGVSTGSSASDVRGVTDALDDLGKTAGNTAGSVGGAGDAIQSIGDEASKATQELEELTAKLNAFIAAKAKMAGVSGARVLNTQTDRKEIDQLLKSYKSAVQRSPALRAQLNSMGYGGGNMPASPVGINASSPKELERILNHIFAATFRADALNNHQPVNTGVPLHHLTNRSGTPNNPQPQSNPSGVGAFVGQIAQGAAPILGRYSPLLGQAAGMAANGAAGVGAAKFAGGGLAGGLAGAGIGATLFGAYKAADALNTGVDENKVESQEADKFRRSIGLAADSFSDLIRQSRSVGEEFHLLYSESGKLVRDFASISKVNDVSQAKEGIGLAMANGIDPSQGAQFMATMRKTQSIGEKKTDARILAVQFAEALKRTGSVLNGGELMTAIQGFASNTAARGMVAPNVEGFAGMLSAIVGAKIPGMDVGNAAAALGRVDFAFQSGGRLGDASDTLQFMALGGAKTGLLGYKARLAGGMFATADDVYGRNRDGSQKPMNEYLGKENLEHLSGGKMAFEEINDYLNKNIGSQSAKLRAMSNHFGEVNPNVLAMMMNAANKGTLRGVVGLAKRHGTSLEKMSASGVGLMAEVNDAGGDIDKLRKVQSGLMSREGMTDKEKSELKGIGALSDPQKMEAALAKFAESMGREKNQGQQIEANTANTAQAVNRMADGLTALSTEGNKLLMELVTWLAPFSDTAKQKKLLETPGLLKEKKEEFDQQRAAVRSLPFLSDERKAARLAAIDAEQVKELGSMNGARFGMENDPRLISGDDANKWDPHRAGGLGSGTELPAQAPPTFLTQPILGSKKGKNGGRYDVDPAHNAKLGSGFSSLIDGMTVKESQAYAGGLMNLESGGNPLAENQFGYLGLYQFGADALATQGVMNLKKLEAAKAASKAAGRDWYESGDHKSFMQDDANWDFEGGRKAWLDKKAQDKSLAKLTNSNLKYAKKKGIIGKNASATELARFAMPAHLVGAGKVIDGALDANGESSKKYGDYAAANMAAIMAPGAVAIPSASKEGRPADSAMTASVQVEMKPIQINGSVDINGMENSNKPRSPLLFSQTVTKPKAHGAVL